MTRVPAVVLITLLSSGIAWSQKRIEGIVARVNTDIILQSDLDREKEMRAAELKEQRVEGARLEQALAEQTTNALRDLIDRALLLQVAKDAGLNAEIEVLKTMEDLRKERGFATSEELEKEIAKQFGDVEEFKQDIRAKYLTQQVIEHEVYGRIVITNEEMRDYYEGHKEAFDKPAGVRVSEVVVLVDNRLPEQAAVQKKKMEEAFAAIKKGDDFEEVARKYSEVATAANGGDLGFFGKGDLNPDLQEVIDRIAKGQTTDILTGSTEFAVYKVTDKHDGGVLTFQLAQQYIWQELMSKIAPDKTREYLTKLRKDGFVEVHEGFVDSGAPSAKASARAAVNP